jgi:hypothetical protein
MLIVVAGAGIGGYIWMQRDKTPVGLVVVNAVQGGQTLGANEDGDTISMGIIEGTWRADENALAVASDGLEKPLLVVYEDGKPIHAEVITMSEWASPYGEDGNANLDYELPAECVNEDGSPVWGLQQGKDQGCDEAIIDIVNELIEKMRKIGKEHGATEESLDLHLLPIPKSNESTQSQEAESIYGPMLSLQSHFVW